MQVPFEISPPIQSMQSCAYALGPILGKIPREEAILYNNFIQLAISSDPVQKGQQLFFIPDLTPARFSECGFGPQLAFRPETPAELTEAILIAVRKGFSIRLRVDDFFIRQRPSFGKIHLHRGLVVYGYDHSYKNANIAGIFNDEQYGHSICPANDLAIAFFSSKKACINPDSINFLAYKYQPDKDIVIDFSIIKAGIVDFLRGGRMCNAGLYNMHTCQDSMATLSLGVNIFDPLQAFINADVTVSVSMTPFLLLGEYTRLMRQRSLVLFSGQAGLRSVSELHSLAVDACNSSTHTIHAAKLFNKQPCMETRRELSRHLAHQKAAIEIHLERVLLLLS